MSALTPDLWREISPYLDHALAIPEDQRAAWLESLRAEKPQLADLLQQLLEEHHALVMERFLENAPSPLGYQIAQGQQVGPYTLISSIGHGGMGSVWLAERSDGRFERRVAVKFLHFAIAPQGAERFRREGIILGQLAHPHIAELIDAGITAINQPYLVLEYVEGEHITQYCDQLKLDVEARIRLFLDVLSAVAEAHAHLVVHRDLKPSNILVRKDGQVKLLDFGIAKLLAEQGKYDTTLLTAENGAALTPQFAAPEQITGDTITTATDVYALGVLLYLLLTGRHAAGHARLAAADLVKAIVDVEPKRPSQTTTLEDNEELAANRGTVSAKLSRQLRGDLDTILGKALKKNPQERYLSVTAFAEDLERYLRHEPIAARPDTLGYRTAKFVRRNRTAVALSGVALVLLIAGVTAVLVQARRVRAERDFAFAQLSRAEAINDLEDFLLNDAAPSGKPITMDDLLERAEGIIEREHGGDANHVDMLVSVGSHFLGREQDAKARPVLEQAYQLSHGIADLAVRASAACALARAISHTGDSRRAEALFQEGIDELPDEPQYALTRVSCLINGREIASARGDSQTAIARVLTAQQVLRHSPFQLEMFEARASRNLAEAYRDAGRYPEAIAAFEQTSASLAALGRDNTQAAGTLYNNWAMALGQSGRPFEAERLFWRAIEISRADNTEKAVSPMLLLNYGRTLRELARLPEAQDYVERAYNGGIEVQNDIVVNQSLLERARVYREEGRLDDAAKMLDQVEPRLRKNLPPGHYAFAVTASERSLVALDRGVAAEALQLATQAVEIDDAAIKAGGQGAGVLPSLLIRHSQVALAANQPDVALSDANRALSLLQNAVPANAFSCNLGRAYMAKGHALQALGTTQEAQVSFQSAAEQLENTLGREHPESRAVAELVTISSQ
jgi:eukaryotic-like serine/threonine-protein kinase